MTALYFRVMRLDPSNPDWEDRDRFILSKGHAAVIYYVALMERGYFSVDTLATYDRSTRSCKVIPTSTPPASIWPRALSVGALGRCGHGPRRAARQRDDVRVYVLLGDSELEEGQVWEAALAGAKFGLDSLVAIVDDNHVQLMGDTAEIMPVEPIPDKWKAFGWNVIECDGHDIDAIVAACEAARAVKGRPSVIVAQTIKGKGVSSWRTRTCGTPPWSPSRRRSGAGRAVRGGGDAPCLSSWPSATPSARHWSSSARATSGSS